MSVSKTASGRWLAKVKDGRRNVASKTFDRKADAEAWHDAQRRALALGDYIDPRAGREQVKVAIARWHANREHLIAGKTWREESYVVAKLPPALANRPVSAVTAANLEEVYGAMIRRGLARSTVARFRNTLSAFFAWCVSERLIAKNPVLESRVPRGTGTEKRAEIFPFALAELRDLHACLRESISDTDAADIVLVLGLTGIRWGELSALRVRDVQRVPRPALRVSRSRPDGQETRTVTKGGGARTVPFTSEVAALILPRLEGRGPDEPLFPNHAGNPRNLANWKRATNWAKVSRGRRVHDLRHTAATLWLLSGVDAKTVQNWLGHSTATLTLDTYAHWVGTDADSAAIARLDALWGDTGGTRTPNLREAKEVLPSK